VAEAHTALGWYLGSFEYDWAGSEREFVGRLSSIRSMRPRTSGLPAPCEQEVLTRARPKRIGSRIRSFVTSNKLQHSVAAFSYRRYDDALREFEHNCLVYPDFPLVTAFLLVYYAKGDFDHAIPACRKTHDLIPDAYNLATLASC